MYRDSGPLTQDETDHIKSLLYHLGYKRDNKRSDSTISFLEWSKYEINGILDVSDVLTSRQVEIFKGLSRGYEPSEISQWLNISRTTIKRDIALTLIQLDANNKTHAVSKLIRLNLLDFQV